MKRFPGRLEGVESDKNVLKKGAAAPSAPPLNLPMVLTCHMDTSFCLYDVVCVRRSD